MKNLIVFVTSLEEEVNILWLQHLRPVFKNYEIVLFKDLKEENYKKIEVAIVANPNVQELLHFKKLEVGSKFMGRG